MADIVAVSEAVADRIRPLLAGWNVRFFEPTKIPIPCVCIEGDPTKPSDLAPTWGNLTFWQLKVSLFAGAIDEEAGVRRLGYPSASDGDLIKALETDDVEDALAFLTRNTGHYVQAATLSGWRLVRRNNARYRSAVISVTVGTN